LKYLILFISFFILLHPVFSQDSVAFDQKKFNRVLIAAGATYGLTLVGLQALWYQNSEQRSFHFFNDNDQWKQVDKLGHFYSAYQLSRISTDLLKKTGAPRKKAIFWGGLTGFLLLTPIEILDGFAADYGASYGDLIANAAGSGLLMGQLYLWDELRIKPKFSFHQTQYPAYNPELLGSSLIEQIIKDYNGQTYWLSVDLDAFIRSDTKVLKWINIGLGYGAEGMVTARDRSSREIGFEPFRQYYFGLDPDLSHIKSRKKAINTIIYILDAFKIPGPTLIFQNDKLLFRPLYF
jgi:hypothetical protein